MSDAGKRPLSWRRAAAIGWREVHSSRGKFLFVVLSVAIGVAALVGVRGFSESFRKTLLREARTLMAGDISARMFRLPTANEAKELDALKQQGVGESWVTEMISMASTPADPVPLLVSLKAVDPAQYPFYGAVKLSSGEPLAQVLTDHTVVVGEDLLIRLHATVGGTLQLGDGAFQIVATIGQEPDRMSGGAGMGPRVIMTRSAMQRVGLLQEGSRANQRLLLKLPANSDVSAARQRVEKILPEAQVIDFRESNPALTEGLNHATGLLSLICLVAMVLGAIGVAMSMRAHLQQRMDILAIMKSIGARSSDILRIYLLQTLVLGLAGGMLGVLLGLGVEWLLPSVIGRLLPLRPELRLPWRSIWAGLGTGVLTTLLFCLPPLLEIRRVRPSLVLRRFVEEPEGGRRRRMVDGLKQSKAQIVIMVVLVLALGLIASTLSDSWLIGRWFAIALASVLAVLLLLAAGVLRLLRFLLSKVRLHLPSTLRHGLANLYRPGNQSAAVLAALGTGVMLILAVFLMQNSIVRGLSLRMGDKIPNVFLIDISNRELPGLSEMAKHLDGVAGEPEYLPVVSGRIRTINNVTTEQLRTQNYPRWLLGSITLTWADATPVGDKVIHGEWWKPGEKGLLAVGERTAERLHLQIGSQIVFVSGDREIPVKVAAIYKTDGQHVYGRTEFVLPKSDLEKLPVIWYGAIHATPKKVAGLQRAFFEKYPTVTVINMADVFDMVEGVVRQITVVVRFLAGFSMVAGMMILASSVASTRFRRIREVVVLKTLGATRKHVLSVFSIEFVVLGLLSGVVGVIFANLLTRVLLRRMEIGFQIEWLAGFLTLVGTALLATATGWVASYRILGQKPLEVLREE